MGKRKLTKILVLCSAFLLGIGGVIHASFKSNRIVETRADTNDPVTYIERSWNGTSVVEEVKTCTEYTEITGKPETLSSGWYVVKRNITTYTDKRITCTGTVNLILSDNAVFRMTEGISTTGATLNIYGQENNSGLLHISNCDEGCAAIGGAKDNSGGTFNFHGGSLWAHGGFYAAAIGSGQNTTANTIRSGAVTIYGGTVYTDALSYGAAIGGGQKTGSGSITVDPVKIYGGNVTAFGNWDCSGIGAGDGYTNNGELTVASGLNVLKLVYNKDPEIMTNYATTRYERMRICAPISYVKRSWDEQNKVVVESTAECISYTNATAFQEQYMSNDTYVVDSNFTTTHDYITIYQTCNLILFDGCSWAPKKGIYVAGDTSVLGTLNIYGQSNGTGTLFAGDGKEDANCAGIGGHSSSAGGKINIFGGRIKAIGGPYSAGIGGTFYDTRTYTCGEITIYGGDVTAIGGTDNLYGRAASGIGAGAASPGYENATPNVTIYGGNVNAIGGEYGGAGIGGGYTDGYFLSGPAGGDCGTVNILGGTVRASGGKGAKGIGAGRIGSNQGTLTVGNTLNVYGEDHKNPGVLIEEGSSGYERSQYMVIKNKEGKIDPEHIDPLTLGGGADQTLNTIDLPDLWAWKNPTALVGDGIGVEMSYTPTNTDIYNTLEKTVDISVVEPITYIDKEWNSTSKSVVKTNKTRTSYRVVTEDMETTWMSGWYLVNNDVTFSDRIICDGTINLILGDGCTLTTTDGISVALGDAINIYSQSDGDNTGKIVTSTDGQYVRYSPLGGPNNDHSGIINIFGGDISSTSTANSDSYGAAAIGGGANANSGPITIYGGKITATGGNYGAGIGGGSIASYYGPRTVGAITIYDGEVIATGRACAPGIGAGYCSSYYSPKSLAASIDVEAIRIYGGNISATGGCFNNYSTGGAGIGCGSIGGSSATLYNTITIHEITINNATVTAQGGNYAAGIGGGYNRGVLDIGSITFNSSNVRANGFSYSHNDKGGAGIGSGYCYTDYSNGKVLIGDITINGSTVRAIGDGGPGIGLANNCHADSSIGNINVNNSYIEAIGSTEYGYDAIGCASGSSQKGTLVLGNLMAVFGDDSENPPTTEREASEYETTRWAYMTLKSLGQPVSLTLGSGISDGYVSTLSDGSALDPNGTAYAEGSVVYGFVKVIEGYIPDSNWTSVGNSVYRVSNEGVTVETSPIDLGEFAATATTYNITYDLGEDATHGPTHPESANYGEAFSVSAPSRPGYIFNGWTVTDGLNTSTAKWGADNSVGNDVSSSSTKCFAGSNEPVYFKNLNSSSGSVTLKANWLKSISYSYSGDYYGPYDGQEHYLIFDVTDPEVDATVKFGMTEGVYDLDECPHFTHPGVYEVYYEVTADGYAPARGSVVICINAKTLNVTVDNKDISYGDDAPTYTYTITGFVSEEDESVLGGTPVFDCSYNQGDNAGEYDINLSGLTSDDYYINYTSGTLTVEKLPSSIVDAPTAKEGLVYNGDNQQLLNAGSASHGHIEYSLDGEHYYTTIPEEIDVGTYTVYYKVVGDQNYSDTDPVSIEVTIAKASSSVVSAPTGIDGLKYTGSPQEALNAGSSEGGTMVYSLDGVNFSEEIPTVTNVGSYTLYYKVSGDGNHNDSEVQTLQVNVSENDKTALTALISEATSYDDEIIEDYKTIASTLQEAIDAANEVKNNPNMTVEQINDAITALQDALNKAKTDHDAIKDAVEAIKDIGSIDNTQACKDNIDQAREEYDALSSEQKALVDNFKTLDDSEKVYDAIETIEQIGKVGYDTESGERIEEARKIYDSLSDDQKAMVSKTYLETLRNSEAKFASNKKTVDILFIILVCVSSLAIIGAVFFLIHLSKKKRNNSDNSNGGSTSKRSVKAMSIGGISPLLVILDSFFLGKKYIIVYILFGVALLIWLICLIVAISKKKNKVATKEVLSSGNDALTQVEDEEVETITDEKGNIFQIRFIKSFTAKLIQSPLETKKYYEELKNEVLSYKNTHSRVSWHHDAINAGREYVLKFAVRGKTLCVYFPLDADNLEAKYKVEKSESKRFEDVPCMYRIKNDRRLGYAKELIAMVANNLGLERGKEQHEVYSNLPYEPNKPLVARGLIKEQKIQVSKPVVLETKTNSDEEEVIISKDSSGNIFQIRFIKSFTAKLIQSPEETKKYYEELKNEVLSYKGTHSRVSWHYDSVNAGRNYVLRFAVRGKTLCVYLPLNADDYAISKYKVEKAESKKFEDVPCLYRIKNDRRLGYAKELIAVVASNLGLEKGEEQHEVYSNLPYEPNKPLVARGLIKEQKIQVNKPATEPFVLESKTNSDGDEVVVTKDASGNIFEIRYIKSFTAKLSQSENIVKDYYTILKNYALSYKGSHSRVSWHYDAINVGRDYVLKFAIRGKTLCVYFALDASKLDEKYKVEVAKIKRFEDTPCLYRIKNDRRCEYAKALIDEVMKKVDASKGEEQSEDYRIAKESTKALLEKGLIKELKTKVVDKKVVEHYESISVSKADEVMSDDKAESSIEDVENSKVREGKKDIINIDTLSNNFNNGDEVTLDSLIEKKLVSPKVGYIKVLARGVLDKKLTVVADDFSIQAVKMIVLTGGRAKKIK